MTTHYAQIVWLEYCVRYVGCRWQANPVPLLKTIATFDRFQGLQARVILASPVFATPGIMHDMWRSNTLTNRAQSGLHFFGRFTHWNAHPTPSVWIAALHDWQWEAGSATASETLEAGVFREAGVIDKVMRGTIYPLAGGGGCWGTGCGSHGRSTRGHVTHGGIHLAVLTSCLTLSASWPTLGRMMWQCM